MGLMSEGTKKPPATSELSQAKNSGQRKTVPELAELNTSPTLRATPTWPGGPAILHQNVALLEIASETLANEILLGTTLANAIVRRLTPTLFMVDHARLDELVKQLTRRGYEPKILQ